jgi:hypothetical protein
MNGTTKHKQRKFASKCVSSWKYLHSRGHNGITATYGLEENICNLNTKTGLTSKPTTQYWK